MIVFDYVFWKGYNTSYYDPKIFGVMLVSIFQTLLIMSFITMMYVLLDKYYIYIEFRESGTRKWVASGIGVLLAVINNFVYCNKRICEIENKWKDEKWFEKSYRLIIIVFVLYVFLFKNVYTAKLLQNLIQ